MLLQKGKYGLIHKQEVLSVGQLQAEGDLFSSVVEVKVFYTKEALENEKALHANKVVIEQAKSPCAATIAACETCINEIDAVLEQ